MDIQKNYLLRYSMVLLFVILLSINVNAACIPVSCQFLNKQCGTWDNKCGNTIDCGPCNEYYPYCNQGFCVTADAFLSAFYTMEDNRDYSINKNDGRITSATRVKGKVFNAYDFNTKGYMQVANSPSLDNFKAISISAWVKPIKAISYTSGYGVIVDKWNPTIKKGYQFGFRNNQLYFYTDNKISVISKALTIKASTWYFVTITYVPGTNDGKLYLDGVDVTSSATIDTMSPSGMAMMIPKRPKNGFNGTIDDVRIYSINISQKDVSKLYTDGSICYPTTCEAESLKCGSLDDGCGKQLICGTCLTDKYCYKGNCVDIFYQLVGKYNLEDNALDSSGLGNNGVIKSATVTTGKVGNAYNFGTAGYLEVASTNSISTIKEITISAWIKPSTDLSATSGYKVILDKWSPTTKKGYQFGFKNNLLYLYTDNKYTIISKALTIKADTWYFVSVAYIPKSTNGKIYLDTLEVTNGPAVSDTITSSSQKMFIPKRPTNGFNGVIDEIRIWNRMLSSEEINQVYQQGNCVLQTCTLTGRECGTMDDNCGNQIDCGTCNNELNCDSNSRCTFNPQRLLINLYSEKVIYKVGENIKFT